jgi:ATP adenylyltransferase/5',5'''-P-1,P-4-tetraphosphate phosphorylase II
MKKARLSKVLVVFIVIAVVVLAGLLFTRLMSDSGPTISQDQAQQLAVEHYEQESPSWTEDYNIVLSKEYPDGWLFVPRSKDPTVEVEGGHALLVSNTGELKRVASACGTGDLQSVAEYEPCF